MFAAAALLGYEVDEAARALALRRGQAQPQTCGDEHDPTCDVFLLGHLAARLLHQDAAHVHPLGEVLQEVMAACDVLMASCDCTTARATDQEGERQGRGA